jgi:hypothetical protein
VISLNEDRKLLVLLLTSGESKTYVLDSDVDVDFEDVSSPDLGDIAKNDQVEIILDDDIVTDINVLSTYVYEVSKVYDDSYNKLKVEDSDGDSKYLLLDGNVDVIVSGISSPDSEDFSEGDIVIATYLGNTLQSVEMDPRVCGEITSINSYTNTVTVEAFDGSYTSYPFDANSKVVVANYTSYTLSALADGDRVAVSHNSDGDIEYTVMTKVSGNLVSIDADYENIYLTPNYSSSYQKYDLSSDCYYHLSSLTISPKTLSKDDYLNLYMIDNLVYEVELN